MGCSIEAQPYRPHERRLDSRIISCYFVGYVECSWGYKFYDPILRSIFETGNARFLEEVEFGKEENIRKVVFEEEPIIDSAQVLILIVLQETLHYGCNSLVRCKVTGEKIGSIRTHLLDKITNNKTLLNQCSRQNTSIAREL